ncbi:cytochrome b/b6 domain-containing protein [Phenylobacterium sp.]|uniref:cytochrome b/b6 domain-containing protein n=1 Tax=Phenylobacterium sp. TaxID=1871053 RepID=UPI00286B5502|nr:cytochrome b/b6 domain-containing protein [Phenylobacterium sp.]
MAEAPAPRVALWDLPTRLFHWSLVVAILVAWFSGGENMQIHVWSGYAVLGLLVFRLWWGVFGGSTARFSSFVKGPGATLTYLKTAGDREASHSGGHNPVGAWSVVAMIAVMLAVTVTGLFASDIDGLNSGPMSYLVDFDLSQRFTEWHDLVFRVLQALVALHLLAVAYYWLWKRQNLIGAMITGKSAFAMEAFRPARLWSLIVGLALAVGVAWLTAKGFRL